MATMLAAQVQIDLEPRARMAAVVVSAVVLRTSRVAGPRRLPG
jgi:hypothetical protein